MFHTTAHCMTRTEAADRSMAAVGFQLYAVNQDAIERREVGDVVVNLSDQVRRKRNSFRCRSEVQSRPVCVRFNTEGS
ncbi:hypothetical protein [Paenibacillus agricola]|uniref:hypothetical protein n=1 Tax=Paenibacillus agricola TaxID=2716264 RepID=UPI001A9EDF3E|nr:hypothetical protein [Paenibacillus agricola]